MTHAEKIAAQFDNDGQITFDDYGASLAEVCAESEVYAESDGDQVRHVFADGSAIVENGGAWDIEGTKPFSWAGADA